MMAETIENDSRSRDWFRRFFYPVSLVQVFRPCDWSDLHTYFYEPERFQAYMRERIDWLESANIKCQVHYKIVEDLTGTKPSYYRLYTEFKSVEEAEAYKLHWSNG